MIDTAELCHTAKAHAMWASMPKEEQTLVRFGMFPQARMTEAMNEGYDAKDLAVALMQVAKIDGGMRS